MTKKPTTFLDDPDVGHLYWRDALKKYESMTVSEMADLLASEVAQEVTTTKDRETQIKLFRIYHTLQTISQKATQEKGGE